MSRTTKAINHIKEELDSISGLCYDEEVEKIEECIVKEVERIKRLQEESNKMTLKQLPPECYDYNLEDEVFLDYRYIAITGNPNFTDYGDPTILSIIKGDYYDDDLAKECGNGYDYKPLEELKKFTGYSWTCTTIRGRSQNDWQYVLYVDDPKCDYKADIEEIESFYMGKVKCFEDDFGYKYYVPYSVCEKTRKAICEYIGLPDEDINLRTISGSHTEYEYEEN